MQMWNRQRQKLPALLGLITIAFIAVSCSGTGRTDAPGDDVSVRYPTGSTRTMIIQEFGLPDSSVQRGVDEPSDATLEQAVTRREQSLGKRVARYDSYLVTRRTDGDVIDLLLYDSQDRLILAVRGIR